MPPGTAEGVCGGHGGHTPALSRPRELAERLVAYAAEAGVSGREDAA